MMKIKIKIKTTNTFKTGSYVCTKVHLNRTMSQLTLYIHISARLSYEPFHVPLTPRGSTYWSAEPRLKRSSGCIHGNSIKSQPLEGNGQEWFATIVGLGSFEPPIASHTQPITIRLGLSSGQRQSPEMMIPPKVCFDRQILISRFDPDLNVQARSKLGWGIRCIDKYCGGPDHMIILSGNINDQKPMGSPQPGDWAWVSNHIRPCTFPDQHGCCFVSS